jgi:hypothetical protein
MHDKILEAITNAAVCGVFVFASGFDSDTRGCIICAVGMAVCIGWIALFELANK